MDKGEISILTLFGMAFGWLEAVVVVYIRKILMAETIVDMSRSMVGKFNISLMRIEQTRELSTLVILGCISFLAEKSWSRRLGVFLWAFAIWDIFYYISLWLLIRWPPSLSTFDCLFLIPAPWIAPVYVPVVISLCMLAIGFKLLQGGTR